MAAPMRNWLAFPSPPIEMLFPNNPSFFLDADVEIHRLAASPPVVKLEDFLGGQRTLSLGSNPPIYDSMEYSSSFIASTALPLSSGDLDDSSSATGNNSLCLSHPHQQPAADSTPIRSSIRTPAVSCQRTSIYRGVTRHRWTGRFEAHLWDNTCRREGQKRKGRQVYLGGYDNEERAARAYDLAALKYWGLSATTNFPAKSYYREMQEMQNMSKQEFIASLRRKSSGFSRGASIYRGVTRHHQHGRWQARIGRVAGNKDLYLGTFATEEEAAEAYDVAAIKFRGSNAVTNFEFNRYNLEAIANSELPIGAVAKKMKLTLQACNNTIRSSAASLPPSGNQPSALLENLLQLQCSSPQPTPPHYYSFIGGGFADLHNQSAYWSAPNAEAGNGEFLQLMWAAASSR